jgi:hypothetical protein
MLLLAIALCVASIIDFVGNAAQRPRPSSSYADPLTGQPRSEHRESPNFIDPAEDEPELHMQRDAAVALLALAVILGASVKLAKISHRRKRLLLGTEAIVVTLLVVAGLPWTRLPAEHTKTLGESKDERRAASYETTPHAELPAEMKIAGDKLPYRQ